MLRNFFNDLWVEILEYYDRIVAVTPKVLMAAIVLVAAWFIARQIRRVTDRKLKKNMEDPLLAEFLATLIRTFVFIIGVSIVFKILGLSGITNSILAGAGITAFIVGFALRDIGENFLAGIMMAFKRPFRVGDFVETGPIKGRVVALSIRDTQLKTPDGKDVYVPNANIIKNPLINYTIDGFLRFDIVVSMPSTANSKNVMADMLKAVESVDGVIRRRRKATVNVSAIASGRLDYTISYWIDTFINKSSTDHVRSNVIIKLQEITENADRYKE